MLFAVWVVVLRCRDGCVVVVVCGVVVLDVGFDVGVVGVVVVGVVVRVVVCHCVFCYCVVRFIFVYGIVGGVTYGHCHVVALLV